MRIYSFRTTAVLEKLFGNTHEEQMKKLLPHLRPDQINERTHPFGITGEYNAADRTIHIRVGFKGYVNLAYFSISCYPSCCGIMMFHSFGYHEGCLSKEQLYEILDVFFSENSHLLGASHRLEAVMVEVRGLQSADPLQDVEPVTDPNIYYKNLWDYFHDKARRVRTRLEVNRNTGNVLHNMEIIL